jgi:predicted peroxiredoxin
MQATRPVKQSRILIVLLAILIVFGSAGVASAEGSDALFVVVTSDDAATQMMAFVLATQAVEQGAEVRVLLCSEGGRLGIRDSESPAFAPRGLSPKELMEGLIERGVVVEVCAIFLPNSEFSEEDLLDGVTVAQPPAVTAYMLQPHVRYFTF